jgi:hypothetical protein
LSDQAVDFMKFFKSHGVLDGPEKSFLFRVVAQLHSLAVFSTQIIVPLTLPV